MLLALLFAFSGFSFLLFAQDSQILSNGIIHTAIITFGTVLTGAVTGVFVWFKGELDECKKDRKELYHQVDKLQDDIGDMKAQLASIQRRNDRKDDEES
jgi:peptidoglycan hydrolase CwlO-like protein